VFQNLFVPIGREFSPDIILVCCGFDAVKGDPMGQFQVSPMCFGFLTQLLQKEFPPGKLVLSMEGGYNPEVVAKCVQSCMEALLRTQTNFMVESETVKSETLQVIQEVKKVHSQFWKSLA